MRVLSHFYCSMCSRCIKIGALSIRGMDLGEDHPVGLAWIVFENAGLRVYCTFAHFT